VSEQATARPTTTWRRTALVLGAVAVALAIALVVVLVRDTSDTPNELTSADQSATFACTMIRQLPADGWTGQHDDLFQRMYLAVSAAELSADQSAANKPLVTAIRRVSNTLGRTFKTDGPQFTQALAAARASCQGH
jgi:hypothetical protein